MASSRFTRPARNLRFITAVIWASLWLALQPASWRPSTRAVLIRQIFFTGLGAVPITAIAGLAVGISVVAQAGVWLDKLDQSALFGPLVSTVVIQNLGPLLVNFFVIGRSGTAITTELANMVVHDEIKVLDSQGIDPFLYLVLPRIIGMALSVLCLAITFIAIALLGGWLFGLILDIHALRNTSFIETIFRSLWPMDMLIILAKTVIPGLVSGAVCCVWGLSVAPVVTAVPQAGTHAVVQSISALFILSVLISLLELL